jgi:hypothetical protein
MESLVVLLPVSRERERDIDAALYNNNNIAGIKKETTAVLLFLAKYDS